MLSCNLDYPNSVANIFLGILVVEWDRITNKYPCVVHKGPDEFVECGTFVFATVDIVALCGCCKQELGTRYF